MNLGKESNFISIVIYLHGPQRGLKVFLEDLAQTMDEVFSVWEIILVNDACENEVREELRGLLRSSTSSSVSVVNLGSFHGMERAMCAGVDLAIGDFVCEVDRWNDGFSRSGHPESLSRSSSGLRCGGCAVEGAECLDSRIFYRLFNSSVELPCVIRTESFRILSRRLIHRVKNANASIPYRKVAYASCGLPATSIKVDAMGDSKAVSLQKARQRRQEIPSGFSCRCVDSVHENWLPNCSGRRIAHDGSRLAGTGIFLGFPTQVG